MAALFGTRNDSLQRASIALLTGACLGGTWIAFVESNDISRRLGVSPLTVHMMNFIVHVIPLLLVLMSLRKSHSTRVDDSHVILICAVFLAIYAASGNLEVYSNLKYVPSAALITILGTAYVVLL